MILNGVNKALNAICKLKQNVLVHCSDGWDRTGQLSGLTQLMLDPHYRTIEGVITLIDKDWLQFGHQFHRRLGVYQRNHKDKQKSPVFVQFLDCVRQLLIQYPDLFEFNDKLLLFIAKELNNGRFGNFFGNNDRDRKNLKVREMTESIWTYVLVNREQFTNEGYDAEKN